MPKGDFYSAAASLNVGQNSPLDATEPRWDIEEPRDDYHKVWGFYAFLYESADSLVVGGLSSLFPTIVGGLTLNGPDVWSVPNLALIDGGGAPAPAQAPAEDLTDLLCTPERLANNEFFQEFCGNLALFDGCKLLTDILPESGFTKPDGSKDFIGLSGASLPNGFTMDMRHTTIHTPGVLQGCDIDGVEILIKNPKDGTSTSCQVCYYDGPLGKGQKGVCFCDNTLADAIKTALNCVKSSYGQNYENLGCK